MPDTQIIDLRGEIEPGRDSRIFPHGFLGSSNESLELQVKAIHGELRTLKEFESLQRIGIACYDGDTDLVKPFAQSLAGLEPLERLEMALSDMGSLRHLARDRGIRIIDEIRPEAPGRLGELYRMGIRSSMTLPIYGQERLLGFIFFNSTKIGFFCGTIPERLGIYAKLIAFLLISEVMSVNLVRAVTKTAQEVTRLRDFETATHLDRMSNYARLIATKGAKRWNLTDEFIEHVYWFAPLHDIGKVAVADTILLKPGKLTDVETLKMRRHVESGVAIIDAIVAEFGPHTIRDIDMARNIIAFHHENFDGSGYPAGAAGHQIPIEGRIVALADVFDALTSERPYKRKWSNEEAIAYISALSGTKFDPDCVDVFLSVQDDVVGIQQFFGDEASS